LIIYVFHLPPCFFPGKEAMLIIIDEIDRRSISKALDDRVAMLKESGSVDGQKELEASLDKLDAEHQIENRKTRKSAL
jgi:hypothetical protein